MPGEYATIHVRRPTRQALESLQLDLQARAGRRLTVTDMLDAMVTVSRRQLDEVVAALASD
jgi:hypothetical protein